MKNVSFLNNAIKFGLYYAAFSIILTLIFYILDIKIYETATSLSVLFFSLVFSVTFILFGIKSYRTNGLGGKITYGQAFGQGFVIGLIATVISTLFNFILYEFIDPSYLPNMLVNAVDYLENQGIPEQYLEPAIERMEESLTTMGQLKGGLIGGPIISLIIALIVAAAVKKDTTTPEIS